MKITEPFTITKRWMMSSKKFLMWWSIAALPTPLSLLIPRFRFPDWLLEIKWLDSWLFQGNQFFPGFQEIYQTNEVKLILIGSMLAYLALLAWAPYTQAFQNLCGRSEKFQGFWTTYVISIGMGHVFGTMATIAPQFFFLPPSLPLFFYVLAGMWSVNTSGDISRQAIHKRFMETNPPEYVVDFINNYLFNLKEQTFLRDFELLMMSKDYEGVIELMREIVKLTKIKETDLSLVQQYVTGLVAGVDHRLTRKRFFESPALYPVFVRRIVLALEQNKAILQATFVMDAIILNRAIIDSLLRGIQTTLQNQFAGDLAKLKSINTK